MNGSRPADGPLVKASFVFGIVFAGAAASYALDSLIWLASGLALACLLRGGASAVNLAAVAIALTVAAIVGTQDADLAAGRVFAQSVEITIGFAIMRSQHLGRIFAMRQHSIMALLQRLVLAAILAPLIAASAYAAARAITAPASPLLMDFARDWLRSALGLLLSAGPLLMVNSTDLRQYFTRAKVSDWALLLGLLAAALLSVSLVHRLAMLLSLTPAFVWAAARLGAPGIALLTAIAAAIFLPLAASANGLSYSTLDSAAERLSFVQGYLLVNATAALCMHAMLRERAALVGALRRQQDQLRSALEQRRMLLRNVAHEMRTPLYVIQTGTHMLASADVVDRSALNAALIDASGQLQGLANDLIETARLEQSGLLVVPEWVAPGPIIAQSLFMLGAPKSAIRIQIDVERIWVDPNRFRQIALNLVSNAMKYGAGPVKVLIGARATSWFLRVTDHGGGFPAGAADAAFEPYALANPSRGDSTGLGLSVVKQIVEAHNGAIAIASTPYVETSVEIVLPNDGRVPLAPELSDEFVTVAPDSIL